MPPDRSVTVKKDADLMWLGGYKSLSYDIYFGSDIEKVKNASKKSSLYKGNQKNNIFSPEKLNRGKTYFWRIDSVKKRSNVKGRVWQFKVK